MLGPHNPLRPEDNVYAHRGRFGKGKLQYMRPSNDVETIKQVFNFAKDDPQTFAEMLGLGLRASGAKIFGDPEQMLTNYAEGARASVNRFGADQGNPGLVRDTTSDDYARRYAIANYLKRDYGAGFMGDPTFGDYVDFGSWFIPTPGTAGKAVGAGVRGAKVSSKVAKNTGRIAELAKMRMASKVRPAPAMRGV